MARKTKTPTSAAAQPKFYVTRHFAEILKSVTKAAYDNLNAWERALLYHGDERFMAVFNKRVMARAQEDYTNPDLFVNNIEHWHPESPFVR